MRLAAAFAILLVSAASASAQGKPLPKFGDYPVKTIYKGKPAKPKIYGDLKRYYEFLLHVGDRRRRHLRGRVCNRQAPLR